MSVVRSSQWLGNSRVDSPHLRLVDSGVRGDFDLLAGTIVSGRKPLVVRGYTMASYLPNSLPEGLVLVVGGGVSLHWGATASGTIFEVPPGRTTETLSPFNPRVQGSFSANTTNYVGIDIRRVPDDLTKDFVTFLDPVNDVEDQRQVPLAETLDYVIVVTNLPFSVTPALLPIATVVTNGMGAVVSVQDARPMLGRLGSGGDVPDALYGYAWPEGRRESATNSFAGGDKTIASLREWMEAVMTRTWEIGGGERWSSAVSDRNVKMFRSGTTFSNGEYAEWDGTNLHWRGLSFVLPNSTGIVNVVADQLTSAPGLTNLVDQDCIYVDLDYNASHVGLASLVALKAPLQMLGAPAPSRSRTILAWRSGAYVFLRDSYYPVGLDVIVKIREASSSQPLYQKSRMVCTTVTPNPVMVLQPLGTFFVNDVAGYIPLTQDVAVSLNLNALAGGSLAPLSRYYIYAYNTGGGVVGYEASTTAPEPGLRTKFADVSRVFVGTFSTNAAADVRAWRNTGGLYRYLGAPSADPNLYVVNGGTATVDTGIGYVGDQVPPIVSEVHHNIIAANSTGADIYLLLDHSGGNGDFTEVFVPANKSVSERVSITIGTAIDIHYHFSNPGGSAVILVVGFNF